jgi:Fe-S-cluster containining protein
MGGFVYVWLAMARAPKASNDLIAENICLSCGMCCNGVIFADVKLLPQEDAAALLSLGLPLLRGSISRKQTAVAPVTKWRFLQPCAAFDGCRCRIYPSRPKYCREFDCKLLKKAQQVDVTLREALRVIRAAHRRANKVRRLLLALGDKDEGVALANRFRTTAKRLESAELDPQTAGLHSQLTLAFHDLSLLLNESFYPAPQK